MVVPEAILKQAADLIDEFGPNFLYLGEKDDIQYYSFVFPAEMITGFPFVYSFDGTQSQEITGYDALDVIALFPDIE